jgi:DNA repair ATPase RecN
MENTSMAQKLNQERENVIAEQKKYKALEKEKQRLEFEVKKLSHHNHELQKSININNNYEDIQHVINELSGMMLSSSKNPNITEKQRKMIKVIFGDVATQAYKDKIQLMEESLDAKTRESIDLREELRNLMANYLDDIHKLDQPRVPISLIQEKLIKNNVDVDPEILRE